VGIDIYLEWDGQEEERQKSAGDKPSWLSVRDGHVGYLREAYHGGPYATKIFVREAFESDTCRAEIPAEVLRERLTHVTEPARGQDGGDMAAMMIAQLLMAAAAHDPEVAIQGAHSGNTSTEPMTVEEAVRVRHKTLYNENDEDIEAAVQAYRDFVELAARKEKELGKPCTVYASY
jgi:hypothetical protein